MLFGGPLRKSASCFSAKTTFNYGATCRRRGEHKRRQSSGFSRPSGRCMRRSLPARRPSPRPQPSAPTGTGLSRVIEPRDKKRAEETRPFVFQQEVLGEDSSSGAHRLRASDATTAVETTETTRVGDTYAVAEAVAALVLAIS